MPDAETPQIYLLTPSEFELSTYPTTLAQVLDAAEIACVRLALAGQDEDRLSRAGDAVREVFLLKYHSVDKVLETEWKARSKSKVVIAARDFKRKIPAGIEDHAKASRMQR